jgi:hypothetical protein
MQIELTANLGIPSTYAQDPGQFPSGKIQDTTKLQLGVTQYSYPEWVGFNLLHIPDLFADSWNHEYVTSVIPDRSFQGCQFIL